MADPVRTTSKGEMGRMPLTGGGAAKALGRGLVGPNPGAAPVASAVPSAPCKPVFPLKRLRRRLHNWTKTLRMMIACSRPITHQPCRAPHPPPHPQQHNKEVRARDGPTSSALTALATQRNIYQMRRNTNCGGLALAALRTTLEDSVDLPQHRADFVGNSPQLHPHALDRVHGLSCCDCARGWAVGVNCLVHATRCMLWTLSGCLGAQACVLRFADFVALLVLRRVACC